MQSRAGFYFIQVGASDSGLNDPLKPYLGSTGVAGLMIEPLPSSFALLKRKYGDDPTILLENSAIARETGESVFYSIDTSAEKLPEWAYQVASFDKQVLLGHAKWIPNIETLIKTQIVPTMSFHDLIRKHKVVSCDLLLVDTEGFDFEILKLFPFELLSPDLVIFEHKHLSEPDVRDAETLLRRLGYRIKRDGPDTIGVKNWLSRLRKHARS